MAVEDSLAQILRHEGGYIDDPDDPGGATNFGITQATLAAWRGAAVTAEDVRALNKDEALAIYRRRYISDPGLDKLPETVQPVMIDAAVNHGPAQAVRFLQHVLNQIGDEGLTEDGVIGPATLAAAEKNSARVGDWLVAAIVEERRRFYFRLAARRPASAKFLNGWLRRIASYEPKHKEIA